MHTAISPPTFASTDRTVNESTDVTVFCTSSARPTPHMFQWTYEGRVLSSNAELQLNNVQRNQTGVYTCTTANVVGTASANITLIVQCEWKGRGREGNRWRGGEQIEGSGKGGGNQHLGFHYNGSNVCVCACMCVWCEYSASVQYSQHTPYHSFPACSPSSQHDDDCPSCGPPNQPHPLLLL